MKYPKLKKGSTKITVTDFLKEWVILMSVLLLMLMGSVLVCYIVPFIMWATGLGSD